MKYDYIDTPIGRLLVAASDAGLAHVRFDDDERDAVIAPDWRRDRAGVADAWMQLSEYFAGERRVFDLPLAAPYGTAFQRRVWSVLPAIPYGQTIHYGELARRTGNPKASRAVGAANGANPLPIVVPCHRVIGANGTLTGFGGGLPTKRWLLEHEWRYASVPAFALRSESRRWK